MLRLKKIKFQTGISAEDTYAKKLAQLQAEQDASVTQDVDKAEMMLLGSYQRPQQVFADTPAANPIQLASPLSAPMSYSPTLSQYVGSTAPIQLAGLNYNRAMGKGVDMLGRGVVIDDVLAQDQKFRYDLQKDYNARKDEIVNSDAPLRQKYKAMANLKDAFKNDAAINAMYQRVQERAKAHKLIDEMKDIDGLTKSAWKQLWDKKYKGIVNPDEYKDVSSLKDRYSYNPYQWENLTANPKVEEKINTYLKDFATQKYGWDKGNIGMEDRADGKYIYHTKNTGEREYRKAEDILKTIEPVLRQDRDIAAYFRQNALMDSYLPDDDRITALKQSNPALANLTNDEVRNMIQKQKVEDQYKAALNLSTKAAFLHTKDGSDTTVNFNETEAGRIKAREGDSLLNQMNTGAFNTGIENPFENWGSDVNKDFTIQSVPTNYGSINTIYKIKGKEVTAEQFQKAKKEASQNKTTADKTKLREAYTNLYGDKPASEKEMLAKVNDYYTKLKNNVQLGSQAADTKQLTEIGKNNLSNTTFRLPDGRNVNYQGLIKDLKDKGFLTGVDEKDIPKWIEDNYKVRQVVGTNYNKENPRAGYNVQIGNGYEVIQTMDNNTTKAFSGTTAHITKSLDPLNKNYYTPTPINTVDGVKFIKNVKGKPGYVEEVDVNGKSINEGKYFPANVILDLETYNNSKSGKQINVDVNDNKLNYGQDTNSPKKPIK